MRKLTVLTVLLITGLLPAVRAETVILTSSNERATLLELYTSEGCSSCPPADRWLSRLKDNPGLWQRIVPVAFHVDYWNDIGWIDRFSDRRYSLRQYRYKQYRYIDSVYTPGLIANGREWHGWRYHRQPSPSGQHQAGRLTAVLETDAARVDFLPAQPLNSALTLNIALLGFNQSTRIGAGENNGRTLVHDFVVLDFQQFPSTGTGRYHWALPGLMATIPDNAGGVALWVTSADDPTPLQATGGFLKR